MSGPTVTSDLRARLRLAMRGHECPDCGNRHGAISGRVVAVLAGVDPSSLSRFLSGQQLNGTTLDKLSAWAAGRP